MVDPGPLKALSDTSEEGGDESPSMEGEEFGFRCAIGVAVVVFFLFLIGAMKG